MAKSSVILAAALKAGATSIISPAQAVIRNQDSASQTLEDNFDLTHEERILRVGNGK